MARRRRMINSRPSETNGIPVRQCTPVERDIINETANRKKAMIKKLTSYLDYSMFAELALVLFAIIFVAVIIRTLLTRSDETRRQANIVLGDKWENKS